MERLARPGSSARSLLVATLLVAGVSCSHRDGGDEGGGGGKFGQVADVVLQVTPKEVVFGGVSQGHGATTTVEILHSGTNGTLTISGMRFDTTSGELTAELPETTALAPGDVLEVPIHYLAKDDTLDSATLTFTHDSPSFESPYVVKVRTGSINGVLKVSPGTLDFGTVASTEHADRTATLLNVGSGDLYLMTVDIGGEDPDDFAVIEAPDLPRKLAPSEQVDVKVRYTPTWWNSDIAELQVTTDSEISPTGTVQLFGAEKGPKMVVSPPDVLKLGSAQVGEELSKPLKVLSQGNDDLVIESVELLPGHEAGLSIEGAPEDPLAVPPGGKLEMFLRFKPQKALAPDNEEPIGVVRIRSNDPSLPEAEVELRAWSGYPVISVVPGEQVHFGIVAQTISITRTVTIINDGFADLEIQEIRTTHDTNAEFGIPGDNTFGPLSTPPVPGIVKAGEAQTFDVTFTNQGAEEGEALGTLQIVSNDEEHPVWELGLYALRAGPPECKVELVPKQVDFGPVGEGSSRVLTLNLANKGSGYCTFAGARIQDCPETLPTIFECTADAVSPAFSLFAVPETAPKGIEPMGTASIQVLFTAPLLESDVSYEEHRALLLVDIADPHHGDVVTTIPGGFSEAFTPTPNLYAASALGVLKVKPPTLDFGLTTIGCHSQTLSVTLYNEGDAPLSLDTIALSEQCSPEFEIKSQPGVPMELWSASPAKVDVVYAPQDLGTDVCSLQVEAGSPSTQSASVPLHGIGTLEDEVTDVFDKVFDGVDVLFVVDDSGSMSEDQENLSTNFTSFLSAAETWGVDFHLGVVTTDVDDPQKAGRLQGTPRYVSADDASLFIENVLVGSNGSGTERGLEASLLALTAPLAHDGGAACTVDTQCTPPDKCIEGGCGGQNRGFMRDNAALHVIYLSDEEDQSPKPVATYIDFLKNLKGVGYGELVKGHAIVGTPGSSCGADTGQRYIEVAKATGGKTASICDSNFSAALEDLSGGIFGAQYKYHLSRFPDPSTLTVTIDNVPCTVGWTFDPLSVAVVFAKTAACLPQPGNVVKIHYKAMCFPD